MSMNDDGAAKRRSAFRFLLLIGAISLFADFTYEGARSVLGPYLASLDVDATTVGIVMGLGEFLGYGLRLVSGRLADATGRFWPITIGGYLLQMTAVPALALTHTWQAAAVLIVLERVGKAVRNPPRDVMISHAAKRIGRLGWVFGIHEACDQLGAMLGPLAVAAVMTFDGRYRMAFAILVAPALLNLCFVGAARLIYPRPQELEETVPNDATGGALPRVFWVYLVGAALVAAGFADFTMIAYHFAKSHIVAADRIPLFYAVAMGASGGASLLFGRLFDRFGFMVLIVLTLTAAAFAPLVFLGGFTAALVGSIVWGMGIGVHESIIPAAVTPMVRNERRASAFGLFTAAYGFAWFAGSAAIGFLYDRSIPATVAFCVATQVLAVPLFVWVASHRRAHPDPTTGSNRDTR